MAKDPAVLFYTSDFLSGTSFFSMEQRGQYITILCEQHQLGNIPESHLLNICGSFDSPVCKKFKKDADGMWFNQRMRDETNKRYNFCDSRRKNIGIRWGKNDKPLSGKKISNIHMYKHMNIHMENENDNEIKDVIKDKNIIPPTLEMVSQYCKERKNIINPKNFIDHYEARGWQFKTGQKMKDWQATVRTWEKNNFISKQKTGFDAEAWKKKNEAFLNE